jgi:hypothetical protein
VRVFVIPDFVLVLPIQGYELHAGCALVAGTFAWPESSNKPAVISFYFTFLFFMDAKQAISFQEPLLQDPGPKRQKCWHTGPIDC